MSRLVVVSNRVAVTPDAKTRAGGLAVALQDALRKHGGVWFGWSGKVVPKTRAEPTITKDGPITYATVDLSRKNSAEYYNGFANRSLWPLFHYRLDLAAFSKQNYSGYLRVNTMFAEKLLPLLKAGDLIWGSSFSKTCYAAATPSACSRKTSTRTRANYGGTSRRPIPWSGSSTPPCN